MKKHNSWKPSLIFSHLCLVEKNPHKKESVFVYWCLTAEVTDFSLACLKAVTSVEMFYKLIANLWNDHWKVLTSPLFKKYWCSWAWWVHVNVCPQLYFWRHEGLWALQTLTGFKVYLPLCLVHVVADRVRQDDHAALPLLQLLSHLHSCCHRWARAATFSKTGKSII